MRRALELGAISALVFGIGLCYSLTAQPFWDSGDWARASLVYYQTGTIPASATTFGYPGATIFVPVGLIAGSTGFSAHGMLLAYMVVSMALAAGVLVSLTYWLRPQSLWWVGVLGGLLASAASLVLVRAVPASALVSLLLEVAVLLVMFVIERGSNTQINAWLALVAALAMLTRWDASLAIVGCACVLLWFVERRSAVWLGIGALAGVVLNPLAWGWPVGYAAAVYSKILFISGVHGSLTPWELVYSAPAATVGVGAAVVWLVYKKRPEKLQLFLVWLLATTAIFCGALFVSAYHPIWYFLPIIIVWQTLCPLLVLDLTKNIVAPEWVIAGYCVAVFGLALAALPVAVVWA